MVSNFKLPQKTNIYQVLKNTLSEANCGFFYFSPVKLVRYYFSLKKKWQHNYSVGLTEHNLMTPQFADCSKLNLHEVQFTNKKDDLGNSNTLTLGDLLAQNSPAGPVWCVCVLIVCIIFS